MLRIELSGTAYKCHKSRCVFVGGHSHSHQLQQYGTGIYHVLPAHVHDWHHGLVCTCCQ